jgi:hypothetical protein
MSGVQSITHKKLPNGSGAILYESVGVENVIRDGWCPVKAT